jgi:hypothetical protein
MITPFDITTLFSLEPADDLPPPSVSPVYHESSLKFLENIHRRKSEDLKQVIAENGWPDAERFGEHAEAAAFMIVQHADYDPELQELCHTLLLERVHKNRARMGYLAFLTDRILCNFGKHQRFGTQIREVTNGCFVPKPMEDPEHVDELREQVGLGESLADYYHRVNSGDLLLYRRVLNGYAEELEEQKAHKVIEFPKNKSN